MHVDTILRMCACMHVCRYSCTVRVENFEGGKFRAIQDFASFRKFREYRASKSCGNFLNSV